ncbi:hypothetical protein Tco_0281834 [Tanacetum coccineum]
MFIEQSHDEVYGCLKCGSENSGGKRLAISMVEEAWLSVKEEVCLALDFSDVLCGVYVQYDIIFQDFIIIHTRFYGISIISVSSDSSKDSVGTPAGRVILFGTIPTTIPDTTLSMTSPTTHTDTTPIPIVSPTIPPSPDYTPTSLDYSPASDTEFELTLRIYSDIPYTPPSPTHDTPFTETTLSTQRSPIAPGALRPSRISESATDLKGCLEDSFEPYVPREVGLGVDFEDESSEPSRSRGTDLEMDVDVVRSDGIEIDPETQAEIDECFAYADALRDRGIDARVVVEAIDREEIETGMRGPVEVRVDRVTHPVVADDIPEPAQEGAVEVTYETLGDLVQRFHDHTEEILVHRIQVIESVQRDQGHMIVATGQQSADMLERIQELERDNRRLRDIVDVESLRLAPGGIWVTVLRLLRDYPSIDSIMPNTRSGASRTRERVNKQREVNGNGGNRDGGNGNRGNGNGGNGDGGNGNGENGNGGNGNGNGNGGEYGYNFRGFMPARECTYQDFLKCQPLNFNGTEGVIGLTCCALTFGVELPQLRTVGIEGRPMPMILVGRT